MTSAPDYLDFPSWDEEPDVDQEELDAREAERMEEHAALGADPEQEFWDERDAEEDEADPFYGLDDDDDDEAINSGELAF